MRVHLIHGIHSTHGGNTSKLAPYFRDAGFDVVVREYGWALALTSGLTNWLNKRRAKKLSKSIQDGDAIVCHSNGAAVAWHIQAEYKKLSALILINPALDQDVQFSNTNKVLCVYNSGDEVVGWAELAPFSSWGAMGRDGPDGSQANMSKIDAENTPGLPSILGHSTLFEHKASWGPKLAEELKLMLQ